MAQRKAGFTWRCRTGSSISTHGRKWPLAQEDGCSELWSTAPFVVSAQFGLRMGACSGWVPSSAPMCPPEFPVHPTQARVCSEHTSRPKGGLFPCWVSSGPCRLEQMQLAGTPSKPGGPPPLCQTMIQGSRGFPEAEGRGNEACLRSVLLK